MEQIHCAKTLRSKFFVFTFLIVCFCRILSTASAGTTIVESKTGENDSKLQHKQQKTVSNAKHEQSPKNSMQFCISEASFCAYLFHALHFGDGAGFISSQKENLHGMLERQIDEGELDDPRESITFCITSIGLWVAEGGKFNTFFHINYLSAKALQIPPQGILADLPMPFFPIFRIKQKK